MRYLSGTRRQARRHEAGAVQRRGEPGLLHRAARLLRGNPRFFRMRCLLSDTDATRVCNKRALRLPKEEEGQAGAMTLLVLDRWSQSEARRTACELSALSKHQTRSVMGYMGIMPWPHWLEGNPPSARQEAFVQLTLCVTPTPCVLSHPLPLRAVSPQR